MFSPPRGCSECAKLLDYTSSMMSHAHVLPLIPTYVTAHAPLTLGTTPPANMSAVAQPWLINKYEAALHVVELITDIEQIR